MTEIRNQAGPPSRLLRVLLPLLVLGAAVATAAWLMRTSPQAEPKPRPRQAALVAVETVSFGPQPTVITAMGVVSPAREIELKPQVAGEVLAIGDDFLPGGTVRRGDLLLTIDPADYVLAVRQREGDVARAEADLRLEEGRRLVAEREYALLGEPVSEVEKTLMLREPQRAALAAALETARARLDEARLDLARTRVTAPFNAQIASREIAPGARVGEGTVLARLVGADAYWVEVAFPVGMLRWIELPGPGRPGSSATIRDRAAWGDAAVREGSVLRLVPSLEEQGRMAGLLVLVDDPLALQPQAAGRPRLLLDAYVEVAIEGRGLPLAAAIPRALVRDGDTAWVMTDDGRLDVRTLEIAFRNRDSVLVTGGLAEGERIVTTLLPSPVPGMRLRLADETPERAGERRP